MADTRMGWICSFCGAPTVRMTRDGIIYCSTCHMKPEDIGDTDGEG
jgi:uncharacterized Zn finger protein (UPF0148 family)